MRAVGLAVLLLLAAPAVASAHPLGNFSVNHQARIGISSDRVDVTYVLDQAEIPTFQERGTAPAEVVRRKREEVQRNLALTVDGRRTPLLASGAPRAERRAGQGGLPTLRLELRLSAAVDAPRRVELRDGTFAGRAGWRAIIAVPGRGTAVRSSAPAGDPTRGLRAYPRDELESPADLRAATFDVRPGDGTVTAPDGRRVTSAAGVEDGFAGALSGDRVLVLLLLAAFGWGAVHALSPGHGKAMVAAYLVGTRGTARDAVVLGVTVTVTHTIGVLALGVVALTLSAWIVPEDLYPWLNLVAGLLVLAVGATVLRSARRRSRRHHDHHHHEDPHRHVRPSRRGLLAMGASAGLVPCPSALVVLLGAIAQQEIALGLVLIVAFSAGLAATLTALGLAVVSGGRLLGRLPVPARLVAGLPAASALAIVLVGCLLTARALPALA